MLLLQFQQGTTNEEMAFDIRKMSIDSIVNDSGDENRDTYTQEATKFMPTPPSSANPSPLVIKSRIALKQTASHCNARFSPYGYKRPRLDEARGDWYPLATRRLPPIPAPEVADNYMVSASFSSDTNSADECDDLTPTSSRCGTPRQRQRQPPHNNKKYTLEERCYVRYCHEDHHSQNVKWGDVINLFELQFPSTVVRESAQCFSAIHYREGWLPLYQVNPKTGDWHPLFNDKDKLIVVKDLKRSRNKSAPHTLVERYPHLAITFDWVEAEDKREAYRILRQDETDAREGRLSEFGRWRQLIRLGEHLGRQGRHEVKTPHEVEVAYAHAITLPRNQL